jgi:hypothetical protein
MILGAINNDPIVPQENNELQELKKEVEELKKQVQFLKYGLIFVAIFYIYNQFKK